MKRNLYEALEVPRNASEDEIRKQYRKLARQYHPDLHPDDKTAEDRFKEIAVAYEILSDTEKRKNYDEFGDDALNPNFDANKAREYAKYKSQGFSSQGQGFGSNPFGQGVDIGDLFSDLFGRSRGRGGFDRVRKIRGNDIESKIKIGFLESLKGTKVQIRITGQQKCQECDGLGSQSQDSEICSACHGTGQQSIGGGPLPLTGPCQVCGGTGTKRGPACRSCRGRGVIEKPSVVTVTVPSGVDNGSKIRLSGKGEPGLGGGPPGDLYLVVEVKSHPKIERKGNNLVMTLPVSVPEAILGAQVNVPLFDGEAKVTIPPGSQTGQKLRLKGKGAPSRKGKEPGDLILVLEVRLPDKEGKGLKKAAESMKKFYESDLREDLKL